MLHDCVIKQTALAIETLLDTLVIANGDEIKLLHLTVEKMLVVGRVLETDVFSFREAKSYQDTLGLAPQDSIIYATIVADLKKRTHEELKCFLSRDKQAFSAEGDATVRKRDKEIIEVKRRIDKELKTYECKYFSSFDNGLNYIRRFA